MTLTGDAKREYQAKWIHNRRMDWIRENGPCVDCGEWTDDLEVDHVDPSQKLMSPTKLWSLSLNNPKRIAELAKCVVRCYRDHKAKTKREVEVLAHGNPTMYRKGCRCDGCKAASTEDRRKYKRNT